MITTQKVMEQLTGGHIVQEFTNYLEEHFDSFADVHKRYLAAAERLRTELEPDASPSADDLVKAIDKQTTSNLLYSVALGLKSNLDHFINPMARTVLDVDFPVFLREATAIRLPEYVQAQVTIDTFSASLSPAQREVFEDVIAYIAYLETTGPKLAHYYGFILGNNLLHHIVLGYHRDDILTMHYRAMLQKYFGIANL